MPIPLSDGALSAGRQRRYLTMIGASQPPMLAVYRAIDVGCGKLIELVRLRRLAALAARS